ncbi:hypothetical protein [uncultured Gilliamella sp.]|uniref:hypothetical protein n=1 Tax=uncultured Gilliamella sp. TaxID=1193505 RepID=UPI0026001A33|nr:hypothetical protein [uncultured Gilliamella sp.]
MKNNNDICFEYEKLFGLQDPIGGLVIQDLMNNFGHATGEFVVEDESGRRTAYNLGQSSVIKYIIAQINIARNKAKEN